MTKPFPTIRQISKDKAVGDLPLLPYSSMMINAFLWVTYGFLQKIPKLWLSYSIGFLLSTYYFLEFIKFAPKASTKTLPGSVRTHMRVCFTFVLIVLILIQFLPASISSLTTTTTTTTANLDETTISPSSSSSSSLMVLLSNNNNNNNNSNSATNVASSSSTTSMITGGSIFHSNRYDYNYNPMVTADEIVGDLGVLCSIIMFASPLIVIQDCIKHKTAKAIPLPFTVAAIMNCFLWSIVGINEMNDMKVYGPSLVGFFFGFIQLYLKVKYDDLFVLYYVFDPCITCAMMINSATATATATATSTSTATYSRPTERRTTTSPTSSFPILRKIHSSTYSYDYDHRYYTSIPDIIPVDNETSFSTSSSSTYNTTMPTSSQQRQQQRQKRLLSYHAV